MMTSESGAKAEPLNAAVWRFDGRNDRVPHEILALEAAGVVRVRLHFAFYGQISFPEAETAFPWTFYCLPYAFDAPPAPAELLERIEPHLHEFLLLHDRIRLDETQFAFSALAGTIHSDIDLFYRLAGYIHSRFVEHRIELLLLDEVPGYGLDYLLYRVARAMGIRTILFLQNIHTERTLVMEQIEEMGRLLDRPALSEPLDGPVARPFEKDLYVPTQRGRDRVAEHLTAMHGLQVRPRTVVALARALVVYLFQLTAKALLGERYRPRGDRVNRGLHDTLIGPELRKYRTWQALEGREKFTVHQPDLSHDYVLFPLHMNPEVTSRPLGGEYADQLRAIERLRRMLPADWRIYAKEHHAGFGCQRDPNFYMRLHAIPGVELIASELEIRPLLAHCRFAATLTGTLGWEAVTGGKPVLTFGHAWYNGLPGVFRIADQPSWQEIADYEIDHEALCRTFSKLSRRFGDFTPAWGLDAEQLPPGLDRKQNCDRFVACIRRILARDPVGASDTALPHRSARLSVSG